VDRSAVNLDRDLLGLEGLVEDVSTVSGSHGLIWFHAGDADSSHQPSEFQFRN